jgi:hypothetical protein
VNKEQRMSGASTNDESSQLVSNGTEVETFSFPDLTVHVSVMMPEAVPNTPELAAAHRRVRQSIVATVMQHLTNARTSSRLPDSISTPATSTTSALSPPLPLPLPLPSNGNHSNSGANVPSNGVAGRPWQGMPLMPLVVSLLNALNGNNNNNNSNQDQQHQQQQQQQQQQHEYPFGDLSSVLNALFLRARPRPQPATEAAISALPRGPLSSDLLASAIECAICKDEFVADDIGVTLPCNQLHVFHEPCLLPWLREHHHTCPLCRHKLPFDHDLDSTASSRVQPAVAAETPRPLQQQLPQQQQPALRRSCRSRRAATTAHVVDSERDVGDDSAQRSLLTHGHGELQLDDNDAVSAATTATTEEEPKRSATGEHVDDVKRSKRRRRS